MAHIQSILDFHNENEKFKISIFTITLFFLCIFFYIDKNIFESRQCT